ncbi:MAG: MBL fold metallo-hydrolase [Candidatus Thorarchaeota archaeon]
MKVEKIGSRGLLFSFKDPYLTNVYVIIGKEQVFILDTSLGSEPMRFVKETLEKQDYEDRPIVIFNSHGDYDHYWGNAVFDDALIIGHLYCRSRILEEGKGALRKYKDHKRGDVVIKAPSLTFYKRLEFPDEGISFFHTPGHTIDSASCFDDIDKVLFVGDNVESPIPYVYNTNVGQFTKTLMSYRGIEWKVMLASHDSPIHDQILLERNIEYISNLQNWTVDLPELSEDELHLHAHNVSYLEKNLIESMLTPAAKRHIEALKKVAHH